MRDYYDNRTEETFLLDGFSLENTYSFFKELRMNDISNFREECRRLAGDGGVFEREELTNKLNHLMNCK